MEERILYFDIVNGISGDMTIATLLDLGISKEVFLEEINKLNLGDEFNPLDGVTAIDALGNDITEKIEVVENTVDTSKEGEYKVVYKVADDNGKEATREIKVTVTKNEEGKKPGIDIKHEEDNNKPGAIPKTGGTNVIYYIGIALILIAGGMYFTFKKKNIS